MAFPTQGSRDYIFPRNRKSPFNTELWGFLSSRPERRSSWFAWSKCSAVTRNLVVMGKVRSGRTYRPSHELSGGPMVSIGYKPKDRTFRLLFQRGYPVETKQPTGTWLIYQATTRWVNFPYEGQWYALEKSWLFCDPSALALVQLWEFIGCTWLLELGTCTLHSFHPRHIGP